MSPTAAPAFVRIEEICARLGISRMTWFRWVKSRQAPAPLPNLPGHPRWSASDIDRFQRGKFAGR